MSLNNESRMIHFIVDLDLVELKYYPSIISLDKCNGTCNYVNDLSMRMHKC